MNAASLDRDRLAKLLGMMGSTHDGEVVAAARQAERLRADAGLTWHEIVLAALPSPRPQRGGAMTLGQAIQFVLDHEDALTDWEQDFARSIQRQISRHLWPRRLKRGLLGFAVLVLLYVGYRVVRHWL